MYSCQTCSKSYAWQDSLKRHIRHAHAQNAVTEDMDADNYACCKCGAVFDSAASKRNHMYDCDQNSDSDISSISSNEEEDESAWENLVQEAYDMHNEEFQKILAEMEAKNTPNAREAASDALLPKNKRSLKALLNSRLLFCLQIKKSEHYKKLMEDIHYYKDYKGFELPEAIRQAIKRNGSILDEVLDEDIDDESESEADSLDVKT